MTDEQISRELRGQYQLHTHARIVLDELAKYERSIGQTFVDRMVQRLQEQGFEIGRWGVIQTFRELDKIGIGRFKVGRRGAKSRFEWRCSVGDVGKVAQGVLGRLGLPPESNGVHSDSEAPTIGSVDSPEALLDQAQLTKYKFPLRKGLWVDFSLPVDLTATEALRLSEHVRTLGLPMA